MDVSKHELLYKALSNLQSSITKNFSLKEIKDYILSVSRIHKNSLAVNNEQLSLTIEYAKDKLKSYQDKLANKTITDDKASKKILKLAKKQLGYSLSLLEKYIEDIKECEWLDSPQSQLPSEEESFVGLVGTENRNVPKSSQVFRNLQKDNPEHTSTYVEKLNKQTRENNEKLVEIQQDIDLPFRLPLSSPFKIVRSPVYVISKPTIKISALRSAKIEFAEFYPGLVLFNQTLIAVNPKINDLVSAVDKVVKSLNSDVNYMKVWGDGLITSDLSRCRFCWVMPVRQYQKIGPFVVSTCGIPSS